MRVATLGGWCWMGGVALVLIGCPTFPESELHHEAGADAVGDMSAVDAARDQAGEGVDVGSDAGIDVGDAAQDMALVLDGDSGGPMPDMDSGASDTDSASLGGNGAACNDGAQCYSGHCVDDVCCNTACAGSCQACDLADHRGECSFVPAGQDPSAECGAQPLASCGRDGACDGAGGCRLHAAGTVCVSGQCDSGDEARLILPSLCDGLGNCAGQGELSCAPYQCDATSGHCFTSCTDVIGCVQGGECRTGLCDRLLAPGAPCIRKNQCMSDVCSAEGVCCDSPCDDPCRTCSFGPVRGKCSLVPAGLDPKDDCEFTPIGTCGIDGTCDGLGACRLWPEGTPCGPASCESSLFTGPARCSGSGDCEAEAPVSCGSFVCLQGSGCYARCTDNTQCKPGCTCNQQTHSCEGSC